MKRIVYALFCFILLIPFFAQADYVFINNDALSSIFTQSDDTLVFVEHSDKNRMYVYLCVFDDIRNTFPTYNTIDNKGEPLFYIGNDNNYNIIHMYIRDLDNAYHHVTICPSWGYSIFEEIGVSQKQAKESLSNLTKTQYHMTLKEVDAILEETTQQNASQTSTLPATEPPPKISEATDKNSKLPSLSVPFSGINVIVQVNGKSYTIRQDYKNAIDKYLEYFNSYVSFANSIDINDPAYLIKYYELTQKYIEATKALEYLDNVDNDDLTPDESLYLLSVITEANEKLLSIAIK